MIFPAVALAAVILSANHGQVAHAPKELPYQAAWAPQWVDFGRDNKRRRIWLRIQRDPESELGTLLEFYSNGHLAKSKVIWTDFPFFLLDIQATVAPRGDSWFLFFDSHPGAGHSWGTNYLKIRMNGLRFEKFGYFEHGDSTTFDKTGHFREYKYLLYLGDARYRRIGETGFKIIDWSWNDRKNQFQEVRHWYSPHLPDRLDKMWNPTKKQRFGALIGTIDYFRLENPAKYNLPRDGHFLIREGYGEWTVGLVRGDRTRDHGLKTIAVLNYPMGDLDVHHPPRIARTERGLILIICSTYYRQVQISKFLVTSKPYKISLLESHLEPEWTPFQHHTKEHLAH